MTPGEYPPERHGRGLLAFASILLFVIGFFNIIYGAAAIGSSNVFTANAHYVIGDLRTWGWITLILGVLIWRQWPVSGLWFIGLCIGIDLIVEGIGWLMLCYGADTAHAEQAQRPVVR